MTGVVKCNNCPMNQCANCPMFGIGETAKYELLGPVIDVTKDKDDSITRKKLPQTV